MIPGEVTCKSQLIRSKFYQFHVDFQGHELGLGVWIGLGWVRGRDRDEVMIGIGVR